MGALREENILFPSYLAQFFLEWEIFQKNIVEKIETQLQKKSCRLWDDVEKYCGAGQATDDNIAHAHCMLII